jgi:hypothetical protein
MAEGLHRAVRYSEFPLPARRPSGRALCSRLPPGRWSSFPVSALLRRVGGPLERALSSPLMHFGKATQSIRHLKSSEEFQGALRQGKKHRQQVLPYSVSQRLRFSANFEYLFVRNRLGKLAIHDAMDVRFSEELVLSFS